MVMLMMLKGEEHGGGKHAGHNVSLVCREVGRQMASMAMLTTLLMLMMLMLMIDAVGDVDGTSGVDDDGDDAVDLGQAG